ncbi:hypothetical protein FRB99_002449 [Tulasnella sp. 403]|nr:hypothetical protein FRB99_002449 [Tulasnella sp. 403]
MTGIINHPYTADFYSGAFKLEATSKISAMLCFFASGYDTQRTLLPYLFRPSFGPVVNDLSNGVIITGKPSPGKSVVFLDIDNTLYPASLKVNELMGEKIYAYFASLGMDKDEATRLNQSYYTSYDPLDFDRKCDGSLPLEDILQPNYRTRKLLQDLDRKKTQVWALTNAYKHHAARVLKILKLDDLVEGIIYCDYANPNFSCKPEPQYYQDAEGVDATIGSLEELRRVWPHLFRKKRLPFRN